MKNQRFSGGNVGRRDVLKGICAGAAGLLVGGLPRLSAAPADRGGQARTVIQVWMWGGPSHLDTFDPKPDAGEDYTGPLAPAIDTNVDGIRVNAAIPQLAQHADKYTIIRSMTHGINGHETASYIVQTGREPGRVVYPCAGAVVSVFKGYEHGYKGAVPPYIVLTQPQGRFSEAGFLGHKHKPFATGGDPARTPFAVEGIVAPGISDERQKARRKLLGELDVLGQAMPENEQFRKFDQAEDEAYRMMLGKARELFDLSGEDDALRERYGRNTFGQSCLVARRLAEHGVPWVTINYKGWDTHKGHFGTMGQKLPEMDAGMATLLDDLHQRGLLERTIVWWGGEFGRTPKVQWEAPWNGGRGHYGQCFSSVVAGGGFQGGRVVGASTERGEDVAERPVYPRDLIASIYKLMGIDPEAPLPNPRGLDVRVLPADEAGEKTGGLLTEVMDI
jgi:hypothetical protein